MKMKNMKYILLALSLLGFSACNTGDDLYLDPSRPLLPSSGTLLTALEVNTFMNYEGELNRTANIYSQHFAGVLGQSLEAQDYDISESGFNNTWAGIYSGTMQNAKLLINTYSEGRPYYSGIGKVLLAMNLGLATDLWGDVPYSDAFGGASGNFTAKYDSQEDVLKSIQTLLDEAIVDLSKTKADNLELVGDDDLIFGGVVSNWIRSAWILKARYANRLSLKDAQGSANKVIEYVDNALAITGFDMEAKHSEGNINQWEAFENERAGYMVANKYLVDLLTQRGDPRLEYYFEKVGSEYVGADIQSPVINTTASIINYDPDAGFFAGVRNFPLATTYELYFLQAEAQFRLGIDAGEALNNAVEASVEYVTAGEITTIAQANYSNPTLSQIMTEKWIAFCGQIEAYNDYRRTQLPVLTPRTGAVRNYTPVRMPTPQVERLGNPDNAKVIELNVPVWWAKP